MRHNCVDGVDALHHILSTVNCMKCKVICKNCGLDVLFMPDKVQVWSVSRKDPFSPTSYLRCTVNVQKEWQSPSITERVTSLERQQMSSVIGSSVMSWLISPVSSLKGFLTVSVRVKNMSSVFFRIKANQMTWVWWDCVLQLKGMVSF